MPPLDLRRAFLVELAQVRADIVACCALQDWQLSLWPCAVLYLSLINLAVVLNGVIGFDWISSGLYRAPGDDSMPEGLVELNQLGLFWTKQQQREMTGDHQFQYCYFTVDKQLSVVNGIQKVTGGTTVDAELPGRVAGVMVTVAVMAAATTLLLVTALNVSLSSFSRKLLFWTAGVLPFLGVILCIAAVGTVAASDLKPVMCSFWTGPGALAPGQKSFCGYGSAFDCVAAATALLAIQGALWLWAAWGEGMETLSAASDAAEQRPLVAGDDPHQASSSAYAPSPDQA